MTTRAGAALRGRSSDRSSACGRPRRHLLCALWLLGGFVAGAVPVPTTAAAEAASPETREAASTTERPNILLLVAEDMSARVGAFGDPVARTPQLDRLAREGVRFPNTFTTSGVCAPSRAALMLGMHAISTGTQHMRTETRPQGAYRSVPPPDAKAFPEQLRRAGYFTFQHAKLDYQFSGPLSGSGPSTVWDAEDNAGKWRDRAAGEPFFGMITLLVTHESGLFAPLGSWPESFLHFAMQLVQAYQRWGWSDAVVPTDPAAVFVPPFLPDVPEVRRDLARHYDNIQIMDAQVGALLAELERDGLADSTIVIWTTDHGDGLPRAKRELFDSGLRVPMIIRWPDARRPAGFEPGEVDERLISFVDLTATILGLAGLEPTPPIQGRDFLDPDRVERRYVFAARDRIDDTVDRQRAVRDDRFKYIWSGRPDQSGGHPLAFRDTLQSMQALWRELRAGRLNAAQRRYFEPPGEERLFDLRRDPYELEDRSRDPAYHETLERMRAALGEFRARVPDWSDEPESEMVERFWPGGEQPVTAPVAFHLENERVVLRSTTPGASIGFSVDGGRTRVYGAPLALARGTRIEARAVRYGWAESEPTRWTTP